LAKFKVVRVKRYVAEIDVSSTWEAEQLADEIPGKDWRMQEDRVTAVIDPGGAVRNITGTAS
jgi:hypothetical protein